MKFTTKVDRVGSMHYIPIPEAIAKAALEQFGKRVVCIVNEDVSIHSAIQRSKAYGYYIMTGKATLKEIKAQYEDILEIEFSQDETEYQVNLSEEFEEVFLTDPEGKMLFDQLSDGSKRGLIHYVNKAKRTDTRIDRALRIIHNLKMGFTSNKELIQKH